MLVALLSAVTPPPKALYTGNIFPCKSPKPNREYGELVPNCANALNPKKTKNTNTTTLRYCKIKDLTCVLSYEGISCVRGSMF